MKKVLLIGGGLSVIVIIFLARFIAINLINGKSLDKESKSYLDKVIPSICKSWSTDSLLKYSVPEMKQVPVKKEFNELFETFKLKLGPMVEYIESKGEANIDYTNGKITITAKYISRIIFEKGSAKVKSILANRDNQWFIYNINVYSPALMCITTNK
jgi:hypothetical protein